MRIEMKIFVLGVGTGNAGMSNLPANYFITLTKDNLPFLFDTINGFYFWCKRLNKYYVGNT